MHLKNYNIGMGMVLVEIFDVIQKFLQNWLEMEQNYTENGANFMKKISSNHLEIMPKWIKNQKATHVIPNSVLKSKIVP